MLREYRSASVQKRIGPPRSPEYVDPPEPKARGTRRPTQEAKGGMAKNKTTRGPWLAYDYDGLTDCETEFDEPMRDYEEDSFSEEPDSEYLRMLARAMKRREQASHFLTSQTQLT